MYLNLESSPKETIDQALSAMSRVAKACQIAAHSRVRGVLVVVGPHDDLAAIKASWEWSVANKHPVAHARGQHTGAKP